MSLSGFLTRQIKLSACFASYKKRTFVICECKYSEISPFFRTFADEINKNCEMTENC